MNKKGQAVLAEHIMIFFVVVAALVAMTVYVQRGFEARIHDARDYMIQSVNQVCDANCEQAAGGSVPYQYEPYYEQVVSGAQSNSVEKIGATSGSPRVIGAVYINSMNEQSNIGAASGQLPPECSGATPPSWCAGL